MRTASSSTSNIATRLLHHPFDSFATFEAFFDAAVANPHVVMIKMTLYRVSNSHSSNV